MCSSTRPRVFNRPCVVCGARATGYHYGAPSCNSCKTFFSREAKNKETSPCIQGGRACIPNPPTERLIRLTSSPLCMAAEAASASRREPRIFDQPCSICGGSASGHHYGVPSCNSCKTFFRRTVLSRRVYSCCSSNGNCIPEKPIGAKIKCKKCRFERCIAQGMRQDLVARTGRSWESDEVEMLMRIEEESHRDEVESEEEAEKLERLQAQFLEEGEHPRLSPDEENAMKVDLLRALRFASKFAKFQRLLESKAISRVVFPLTVAKISISLVDEHQAEAIYGSKIANMVHPFKRANVQHTEFVLLKTLLLLQRIGEEDRNTSRQDKHSRLILEYLGTNSSDAPGRYATLLRVFQEFIAAAASPSRRSSQDF